MASDITALTTTVGENTAAVVAETTARTNADTSLASDITSLTSTVNGVSAAVTTEASTRASADTTAANGIATLEAKYGVKLNVNGYVTGFEQNNDGTTGSFKIMANEFKLIDPTGGANQSGLAAFTYSNNVVSLGSGVKLTADSIIAGELSADRIKLDGSFLSVVNGELVVTGAPGIPDPVVVDTQTGNTDASVTVTRTANSTVSIGVNWSLARKFNAASYEPGNPFPATVTLKRGSTTIKTWTITGIFTNGSSQHGEPFLAFGHVSANWYDTDNGSGSTTYTLSATTLNTSNFNLETQLSVQTGA